jgi:hypothetical protein
VSVSSRLALVGIVGAGLVGCARGAAVNAGVPARSVSESSGGSRTTPSDPAREGSMASAPDDAALQSLRAAVLRGDSVALTSLGLTLGRGGETEIDGARAADERVTQVDVPVRDADSAAMLVRTSCGNVRLLGLVRRAGAWSARASLALVPAVTPGRCVRSSAVVQPVALRADPAREVALGVRWEDATADEVHGPSLWVAGLDAREGVVVLLEQVPFGGTDDRTGASTEGSLAVIDELPPPRAIFVEIRPGRRGAGGPAPGVRTIRRYEFRGARMDLVDEQQSALESP